MFSAALLLYLNPEIVITRGNRVPENFAGTVFDIGRGRYDHHQKDSRVRENGVPYAAFGLLWEELGEQSSGRSWRRNLTRRLYSRWIITTTLGRKTSWRRSLAILTRHGMRRAEATPPFQAVSVAGMILENKFERYRGNERADRQIEEVLAAHERAVTSGETAERDAAILILPYFIPCQKRLSETGIAFVIFPSNRGGYCIQPQKREYSLHYKCCFPERWLGLEKEELVEASGLESAVFCHKGRFSYDGRGTFRCGGRHAGSVWTASRMRRRFVNVGGGDAADELLRELPGMAQAQIYHIPLPELPGLEQDGSYGEVAMEKTDWKLRNRDYVKQILQYRPEAVYVEGMYFRHIRWCICSGKARAGACHGRARRGADPRADSVRFLDGTCRRRAKSAMILMQCGICFREFLLPAKRQENQIDIPRRNG